MYISERVPARKYVYACTPLRGFYDEMMCHFFYIHNNSNFYVKLFRFLLINGIVGGGSLNQRIKFDYTTTVRTGNRTPNIGGTSN